MEFNIEMLSQLFVVIGVLVAIVNIITEVFKKVFEVKSAKTINGFVMYLSIVLTVCTFAAYFQINQLLIEWYIIVAFIIVGVMVAYAAMFGYDKLLSYFKKEIKNEYK